MRATPFTPGKSFLTGGGSFTRARLVASGDGEATGTTLPAWDDAGLRKSCEGSSGSPRIAPVPSPIVSRLPCLAGGHHQETSTLHGHQLNSRPRRSPWLCAKVLFLFPETTLPVVAKCPWVLLVSESLRRVSHVLVHSEEQWPGLHRMSSVWACLTFSRGQWDRLGGDQLQAQRPQLVEGGAGSCLLSYQWIPGKGTLLSSLPFSRLLVTYLRQWGHVHSWCALGCDPLCTGDPTTQIVPPRPLGVLLGWLQE